VTWIQSPLLDVLFASKAAVATDNPAVVPPGID